MTRKERQQLMLEVEELTALLRSDPAFAGLRKQMELQPLPVMECVMAGCHEEEDGGVYGVIVTPDGEVFEFASAPATRKQTKSRFVFTTIADVTAAAKQNYPALQVVKTIRRK